MRKALFALALLACALTLGAHAPAHAQMFGPSYNPANVNITGGSIAGLTGLTATGDISTTTNVVAYGTATTGPRNVTTQTSIQLFTGSGTDQPTLAHVRSGNTPNNRIAYSHWFGTTFIIAGFANDAFNVGAQIITATGGQATGITGVQTNSGSGAWAHTGTMTVAGATSITGTLSATGLVTASGGLSLPTSTVATLPACTAALQGVMRAVTDAAAAPVYNATVTGGGTIVLPVMCNGAAWTNH